MIIIKNDKEIDLMRIAGRIVAETLLLVEKKVKPGITTAELDRIAEEFITKHGAIPSFKGLYGFPASLCISVNEQVVHGIPGGYVLKDGDIVSVDCGAYINGFHGDAARTFAVGNVSEEARKLIKVTEESFFKGLEVAKVGNKLTDIWKSGGIKENFEYAILTNEIYKEWSGMTANEYKNFKGIRKENLRDNMTDIEIALTDLAELTTRHIAERKNQMVF